MKHVTPQLQHVIDRGYVIKGPGGDMSWKDFYTWCVAHAQPFVYVDHTNKREQHKASS